MEKRPFMLRVRLSKTEKEKLDRDCKKSELDASKFVRKLILQENILSAPTIDFYEFINELNRIGTNLNQLTKKANKGDYDEEHIHHILHEIDQFLVDVKKEILGYMAYTKIIPIHNRMDHCLNYICNEKKTIDGKMNYASNEMAIEDLEYTTCWNCSMFHPYEDMESTKKKFGKSDSKRKGFHLIQSFKPGEGTADIVHEIGLKWAKELFGDRYEFVVSTHLDKDYLHNHIIVNSTSFMDGKQFTNTKEDIKRMMDVSNRLCKEYGLSVIENPKRNYGSKSIPGYIRTSIKKDIDRFKEHSSTWTQFEKKMELEGYQFEMVEDIYCVCTPSYKYPIPLSMLGQRYSKESIVQFILDDVKYAKDYHYPSFDQLEKKKKKLTGLQKLYYRFLYDLGILPKYKVNKKLSKEMRKECQKLDQINQQVEMMVKMNINTIENLNSLRDSYQNELDVLLKQRKDLYSKAYHEEIPVQKEKLKLQAKELTPNIKELRIKIKQLDDIEFRSARIEQQLEENKKEQCKQIKEENDR